MKKRVLSLFLCFVLCLSLCPTAAFADGEDGHTHEPEETAPLVVSATMAPEVTEAPVEPAAEPEAEPEEEPAEPTPEPAPETPAETAPEAETEPTPEPTAESTPEATAEPVSEPEAPVVDDAVAAVQALIDALPAVDSVSAEDYDAVQNAYDAYDALTAEQRSHITGAEAFEALFNWFNEQVMELAESCTYDENGFCQNKDYTDNNHNYINCYEPAELDSDGYYQIGNAGQLYWFADWVNDGHPDSNAELTGDITVNSGKFGEGGNYTGTDTPRKFSWIGQSSYLYKGTFNGNNYTIYGLYYKAKESGKTGTVGLFRPDGATIKNLTIDNMYISAPQSTVGLIVEDNCSVTVENVTVQNSYIISQNAGTVGAIVAKLKSGSVSNCRSINNVVQGKSRVGAIVGWNDDGTVKNCYSTGTVSGTSQVGAIVGYNNRGSVDNCYYLADEETTMQNGVAGKTEAQFKSGEVAYLLNESKNNGTWKQTIGTDAFPNFTGSAVYCTTPCPTYTNDAKNLDKEHNKVKGTCTVCGDGCKHTNWTDDGVCADCKSTAVAKMTKGDATSYFMDLGKALLAAAADSGSTVTVLEAVSSNVAVDLSDYRSNITLDLNGKTVEGLSYKYGSERCPLTVKDSASGGTLNVPVNATAKIQSLTVSGGETKLSGGTYNSITVTAEGKTADDLLDNGYAYFQTAEGGSKTWLTVTNETALQNVSVGMIPLKASDLSISSSPQNPTYGDNVTVTVSYTGNDSLAYQWFEVVNGTESEIEGATGASYTATTPDAGSHTYRCKVTKDGYTVTLEKTIEVAKADIGDGFFIPKANTGLIYNGGAQELISAGAFSGGVTGCTILYKLGEDGTYRDDISALNGTDAKTYTVYYYVDGGTNYYDIGSADSPRAIDVTIAPLNIGGNSARTYYVTAYYDTPYYNGQPQTPAITLALVHRIDTSSTGYTIHKVKELVKDEDFDCTQSVTQYTNAGFYTISFTGKGNYAGTMTVDWGIERLDAPDATGSLTVYNQIAHTYTVDLASLLPELPSGYEYGKLSYELKATDADENPSEITVEGYLGEYSLTNGTLTLPVNAVDSTDTDTIATLRVTVTPENYFPFTLALNVNRANRVSPIDVGKPLDGLTKDNVTSDDREALEKLLDDLDGYLAQNPGEGEKKELEELKKEAEELIERLDDAKAAMEDDAIGAADDIDASNAKPGHKGKLRSAKRAIQDALDTYGPNYTEAEKAALNEKLTRINAALAAIEKAEQAEKPDEYDKTDKGDKSDESDKSDKSSQVVKTGDEATPILWIVLIVVAVGCVVVLLAARKKKK